MLDSGGSKEVEAVRHSEVYRERRPQGLVSTTYTFYRFFPVNHNK